MPTRTRDKRRSGPTPRRRARRPIGWLSPIRSSCCRTNCGRCGCSSSCGSRSCCSPSTRSIDHRRLRQRAAAAAGRGCRDGAAPVRYGARPGARLQRGARLRPPGLGGLPAPAPRAAALRGGDRRRPRHHGGRQPRRRDAGAKSIGLNIVLPQEQAPNPYITPELCFQFHYFALRKMHFLLRARALVVLPGRLRHARRAVRRADPGPDRQDRGRSRSCCSARATGGGSSISTPWSRRARSPPRTSSSSPTSRPPMAPGGGSASITASIRSAPSRARRSRDAADLPWRRRPGDHNDYARLLLGLGRTLEQLPDDGARRELLRRMNSQLPR